MQRLNRMLPSIAIVSCFIILSSCAQIRKVTYPSDFVYLDDSQVKTSMLRISLAMRNIDNLLLREPDISVEKQRRILESLNTIDAITDTLSVAERDTNHLLIERYMQEFKQNINNAIYSAKAEPPNFYAAAQLSANCIGCHRYRN